MINIRDYWDGNVKRELTFVDLFSGCGGVSQGYVDCGFKPIASVDFLHSACETHRRNIPECEVVEGDITLDETKQKLFDVVKDKLGDNELDVLHASPPCQGFSIAGKRMIDDPRNRLYKEAVEIMSVLKPRWITMENVPGMVSMRDGDVVRQIEEDLTNIGYKVRWMILNSADYYSPQTRRRWILIGNKEDKEIDFPEPMLNPEEYITMEQAIGDLVDHPVDVPFNHVPQRHSKEFSERLAAVEEGKSLYGGEAYPKTPWNKPANTIKQNHGSANIHPRLPRVITVREMARLQDFPDTFIFEGSKSDQMLQIGNAVPCKLSRAMGLTVMKLDE